MWKSARQRTQRSCSSAVALAVASLWGRQGDASVQAGDGHGYSVSWHGKGKEKGMVKSSLRAASCCLSSLPVPSCAHPGGHTGRAGVEVCTQEGDVVLTLVPSPAGPCETPWVLLVRAGPPWVRATAANRPQVKALASLTRPGDGKGPQGVTPVAMLSQAGSSLPGAQRRGQALSSWCSAERIHSFVSPQGLNQLLFF